MFHNSHHFSDSPILIFLFRGCAFEFFVLGRVRLSNLLVFEFNDRLREELVFDQDMGRKRVSPNILQNPSLSILEEKLASFNM